MQLSRLDGILGATSRASKSLEEGDRLSVYDTKVLRAAPVAQRPDPPSEGSSKPLEDRIDAFSHRTLLRIMKERGMKLYPTPHAQQAVEQIAQDMREAGEEHFIEEYEERFEPAKLIGRRAGQRRSS